MKDYYQVLGISHKATQGEIKTAYRKLVVRYHPDVSKDPLADQKIKEINVAYNVLSNLAKRYMYDLQATHWEYETKVPPPAAHRDPAYRRRGPIKKVKTEQELLREWMMKNQIFPSRISIVVLLFCALLIIDFILPHQTSLERIEKISSTRQGIFLKTNADEYKLPFGTIIKLSTGQEITIRASPIFDVMHAIDTQKAERVLFKGTIYGNFIFAPIILLLCSLLERFAKWNIETRFNLAIANVFVFILSIVFLLIS